MAKDKGGVRSCLPRIEFYMRQVKDLHIVLCHVEAC